MGKYAALSRYVGFLLSLSFEGLASGKLSQCNFTPCCGSRIADSDSGSSHLIIVLEKWCWTINCCLQECHKDAICICSALERRGVVDFPFFFFKSSMARCLFLAQNLFAGFFGA